MYQWYFWFHCFWDYQLHVPEADPLTITAAEYFFDTDPGIGLATPLSVTPRTVVTIFGNPSAALLQTRVHTLYVRYRDSQGKWSVVKGKPFRVLSEVPYQKQSTFMTLTLVWV